MVSPGTFSPSLLLLEPFHQNISIQGVDRKISVYNNNPSQGSLLFHTEKEIQIIRLQDNLKRERGLVNTED